MRSLWSGAISFGMVNISVNMYAATEDKNIRFNYLHQPCHTKIRYQKVCPNCQIEVSGEEIVRGYEYTKGEYVVFSEEELAGVAIEATKTIDILDFVDIEEIDPIYFDKTYYLEAGTTGAKAYQLLKQAMEGTGKIGIAKVMIRTKQVLAVIRVYNQILALETIFFPTEIRQSINLNTGLEKQLTGKELEMAMSLISSLAAPFQPEKFVNEYQEALLELVEQKIAGKETVTPSAPRARDQISDLMTALEASLQAAEAQNKTNVVLRPH